MQGALTLLMITLAKTFPTLMIQIAYFEMILIKTLQQNFILTFVPNSTLTTMKLI